ncbi:uncharacterized protein LOC111496471 isoform X2 [Cucurbita maxima]|uniref:Uncharacterized protein LOC111496471 isoform X2 n=1 Tax=Cucurbita maxima TaxID=3661 RepID=A0A6J1KPN8_CUCMA|nr:uncharacterized protein LOC111496471 isoform X2 [Cucurbita maxima]
MSASKFQTWAEDEANRLMKKYDTNGDGMLTKEELQVFLHKARGSKQLNNNQGFVFKIPKANNNVAHEHSSNSHMKHKKQVQDKGSILPFNKAHYAMAYADTNHDGLISEFELDKLIDYASKFINKI